MRAANITKYNRLLVTGATGRVGSAVVESLPGQCAIRACARTERIGDSNTQWSAFDLERTETYAAALDGVDAVFLMRPPQIARAAPFEAFLDAARSRNIRRIIFLSVVGAGNNALLPHHGIEKLVQSDDFDWTIVRPSDFMQNLETVYLHSIRDRNEIAVPAGRGRSSFIDVADIGEAIAALFDDPASFGRAYTLTGQVSVDFNTVADVLTETLGRHIRYRPLGIPRFLIEQYQRGQPLGLNLVMTALYTVQRFGGAKTVTNELKQLIGRPATTLEQYIRRNREVWLSV